jgi:uncharacterized membrane protein YfbV (UPF0208 family)
MPEPAPWTPQDVRTVAEALYGSAWQTALAADISAAIGKPFRQARISQWYVANGSRPIPVSLQPTITAVFRDVLARTEETRAAAAAIVATHEGDPS